MASRRNKVLWALGLLILLAGAGVVGKAHSEALRLTTSLPANRKLPEKTPADYHIPFIDVGVNSNDGLKLVGWYLPGSNGATMIFIHGYKDNRGKMLGSAAMFHEHGYGVFLLALRAHDYSQGTQITFGHLELDDVANFYNFLQAQPGVDKTRIGMLGVSMGAAIAIQYTAKHPEIRLLVADSSFSSMDDTIATSVKHFTGLPPFPFASLIGFWIREMTGLTKQEADEKIAIARIAPRPVFLMQGGMDEVVSPESGQKLYDAAGQPKELWFDPALGHARFFDERRAEYEKRVLGFVDTYMR